MSSGIDNPILNGPYDAPDRHYEIGPSGPTGVIIDGRRPSESFIPIAVTRKGKKGTDGSEQEGFDFDLTGERREKNSLINDIRRDVDKWRASGHYDGVTPITRKLLQHWADEDRENRVIFAQREAAETAIFLTEVAGRHPSYADWRKRLEPENAVHNEGLPRAALKMATGAGKTIVMAMLIAWQTLNKAQSPNDARFTNRFLIVAPGITIRDRLNVLLPETEGNYYDLRNLIPSDLKGGMESARIVITNFHAFQLKDAKEIKGVAKNTRLLLKGNKTNDPFKESPKAMVSRVLRGLGVTETGKKQQIMVLNDEAHHCYLAKPLSSGKETSEEKDANEKAGLWFNGLRAIAKYVGIKQIFDLSATPFYLSGSGYAEGYIFPWVVSDFSLMDAIESGIVKVPRTPVDDDAETEHVVFLRLWEFIGKELPKRAPKEPVPGWMPKELEAALRSLHRSYEKAFSHWEQHLRQYGETPPVFIVVCPNTVVSKLVYTWIAGEEVVQDDEVIAHRPGELALLSNVVDGSPLPKPRTILIDSAQIESGEAMKADFKQAAGAEIAQFKAEYRKTNPGADVEKLTDEDLLREVMNTVGKPGKLGADIRCVVSVSMLTEGWDANTVTHILGVRAFKSQLLCEQVVGRGLRRRSYEVSDETGRFEPEYANVYGIPFQFVAGEPTGGEPAPPKPSIHVHAVEGREHLRINFPKLDGYRVEIPDEDIYPDFDQAPEFPIGKDTVPSWVELGGLVGKKELEEGDPTIYRTQEVAFRLAKRILDQHFTRAGDKRPWLFPKLVGICSEWIDTKVVVHEGYSLGFLVTITQAQILAAEQVWNEVIRLSGNRRERLRPMINRFDPEGSTGDVDFVTRKRAVPVEKSEVSHVTLDGNGPEGNAWEKRMAAILEADTNVAAFVKNDQLGLTIPYVHKGRSHSYIPDFLVRLKRTDDDVERTLIIEISGSQKSPGPTNQKAETARNSWCVAVNNHGGWGRWAYIEMKDPDQFKTRLADAIQSLYGDKPIIGDPELLDFAETNADTNTARSARGA